MKVRYSCRLCSLVDAECEVVERPAGQDIEKWMNYLSHALKDDHTRRSPHCLAEGLQDVKIPADEGQAGKAHPPVT